MSKFMTDGERDALLADERSIFRINKNHRFSVGNKTLKRIIFLF